MYNILPKSKVGDGKSNAAEPSVQVNANKADVGHGHVYDSEMCGRIPNEIMLRPTNTSVMMTEILTIIKVLSLT